MLYVLLTEWLGSGLPIRPGGFDSHRALSRSLVASKYGCGLMVSQLPLKQLIEGSNPSARAVAVLYWFQELGCELSPCRFDSFSAHSCEHGSVRCWYLQSAPQAGVHRFDSGPSHFQSRCGETGRHATLRTSCHQRAGDRTPVQARMKLRKEPVRPAWKPIYSDRMNRVKCWSKFISERLLFLDSGFC